MECAPFARAVSGLQLRAAAADWWPQAEGRYHRTQTPAVGSVLVFQRSTRLPDGHVAVVSRVLSDRRILVTHAIWVRHQVSEDVPVIDVSPDNDWTTVRVWWPPTKQMGVTEYASFGFIEAGHRPITTRSRPMPGSSSKSQSAQRPSKATPVPPTAVSGAMAEAASCGLEAEARFERDSIRSAPLRND